MKQCAICDRIIEKEDAPILTVGGYGVPRYLCDGCAADIDTATLSHEPSECADAIAKISDRLASFDPDSVTYKNVCAILDSAKERAKLISEGEYDFSLDESDDELDDVPEELRETEEDRALDAKDEEKEEKVNKFFNWVYIGAGIGLAAFVIWKLVEAFILK